MRGRWRSTTGGDPYRFFSPEQVDKILSEGAKRGRAGSHAAIERILKLEPGVERAELWQRIRQLKYPSHGTRYRRSLWSAEDDQILSRGYERGWSGKQEAVRELLKRHPDWRAHVIWRRAAKLQLIRQNLQASPGAFSLRMVRGRRSNSPEFSRVQDVACHRQNPASVRSCRALSPHALRQE